MNVLPSVLLPILLPLDTPQSLSNLDQAPGSAVLWAMSLMYMSMGTCSKMGCVQRYITTSPFMQLPILADQITLSSNYLCLTLDKEGWKWVWERRGKWSLAWGVIGLPIFLLHKECEIYGWVFIVPTLAPAAVRRGCFPHATGQFCSAFIPCTCYYASCSDEETLPST